MVSFIHTNLFFDTRVARAGRFGTKGLAITFVSDETDAEVLNKVQERFEVNITELPDEIDHTSYSKIAFMCILNLLFGLESFFSYILISFVHFCHLITFS